MEVARPAGQNGKSAPGATGERASKRPSVESSLEDLVTASQGVITNRIELALLEGRALLARTARGAGFIGLAIVLAAAAWFAAAASGVLLLLPGASPLVHLAAFALLNGGCATVLVFLAMRSRQPPAPKHEDAAHPTPTLDPSTAGESRHAID